MGKSERDIYWERISSSPATQPVHADISRGQHKLRFHRNAQTAGPESQQPGQRKEKKMPRIKAMTMRYLRSNFLTKVSAMNEMRMPYSFEPTCRLAGGDLEVPTRTRCDLAACASHLTKHAEAVKPLNPRNPSRRHHAERRTPDRATDDLLRDCQTTRAKRNLKHTQIEVGGKRARGSRC